jgi:GrpB-like predicted nucleotidyltransferase (UPF0157 family)
MDSSNRDEEIAAAHVNPPELLNGPVALADYDPSWKGLYEREEARIRAALTDRARLVEHVGSTSVPGLAAKPKIDIVLTVENSGDEPAYVPTLEAAGYVLRIREPHWHEHRLFDGVNTVANLHVFSEGCDEVDRLLRFRDHLRANATDRLLYESTKRALAQREWKYMQNYADAKSAVVEQILLHAKNAERAGSSAHR